MVEKESERVANVRTLLTGIREMLKHDMHLETREVLTHCIGELYHTREIIEAFEYKECDVIEHTCRNCKHDGNQAIYPSGCTGCTPCGDESFLRNWEPRK